MKWKITRDLADRDTVITKINTVTAVSNVSLGYVSANPLMISLRASLTVLEMKDIKNATRTMVAECCFTASIYVFLRTK
jgi:hypothetical protein